MDVVQAHRLEDLWAIYPGLMGGGGPRLFLLWSELAKRLPERGILDGLLGKKLSGVIVPTGIGKRVASATGRLPKEKIAVIPPGFDPAAYEPGHEAGSRVRAGLELEDDHVVVGTIGRIEREKGQYELLEAARTVLRSYSALRLVIAGDPISAEGEKLLKFMRRRVCEYHMDEVVKFMPFPESIPELLSAFDIFAMPSLEENFAGHLAEAMLSGLACVGTDAGGTPEVLENGKAGLLAPSGSADGIARALMMLLETPDLRGILGRRARESARERFDTERVMKRIEELYSAT
jgi:glycosyltransferase involved in cell wall biosynthesis